MIQITETDVRRFCRCEPEVAETLHGLWFINNKAIRDPRRNLFITTQQAPWSVFVDPKAIVVAQELTLSEKLHNGTFLSILTLHRSYVCQNAFCFIRFSSNDQRMSLMNNMSIT